MTWRTENAVVYVCTTVLVLGLYYMSNSFHSLWGLALLMFVSTSVKEPTK
jgi:CobQ-like glutamine amidotransferase family enzyme